VDIRNGLFTEGPFTRQYGAGVIKFRKVAVKSSRCSGRLHRRSARRCIPATMTEAVSSGTNAAMLAGPATVSSTLASSSAAAITNTWAVACAGRQRMGPAVTCPPTGRLTIGVANRSPVGGP
jgi:hypothetical protein